MENEKISVVIAAYNAEKHVGQTIESVLSQTYTDYKVYIVDDGSTDRTRDIINRYTDNPKIVFSSQNNCGQAAAKNYGVKMAQGELIAFLDADDLWVPDKLQKQVKLFDDPAVGFTCSNLALINESGQPIAFESNHTDKPRGKVTCELFQDNLIAFSSSMIRRELFNRIGGMNETLRMGIDWDLWLRASLTSKFDYVDDVLLLYRVWSGQMSKNIEGRYEGAFSIMSHFLQKNPDELPKSAINSAFARTYANRAYYRRFKAKAFLLGFQDIHKAFRFQFLNIYVWKVAIRMLLNWPRRDARHQQSTDNKAN